MKQSRLFPAVLLLFMAIFLISVSHLSAAVTTLDDFEINSPDTAKLGYHDRNWPAGQTWLKSDFIVSESIETFEHHTYNPYDPGNSRLNQKIYTHTLFLHDPYFGNEVPVRSGSLISSGLVSPTFWYIGKTMPDELLTQQKFFQTSIPDWPSEWDSNTQPASEPADDIISNNDVDYIKTMRIPAPTSLLLVTIGLLSLRYTRRLRY